MCEGCERSVRGVCKGVCEVFERCVRGVRGCGGVTQELENAKQNGIAKFNEPGIILLGNLHL